MSEVYIDGCNVAECKNFSCGICEEENKIPRTIEHFTADCAFYPNCYFKQLQRLKEENEELRENNDWYNSAVIALQDENEEKVLKMAECEVELEKHQTVLEEVQKYCNECNLKADWTACNILRIIDEGLKGDKNE